MKCNNCGKDFGNNLTCQHCGIDRVAGLANHPGESLKGTTPLNHNGPDWDQSQAFCWKCQEIIPANA